MIGENMQALLSLANFDELYIGIYNLSENDSKTKPALDEILHWLYLKTFLDKEYMHQTNKQVIIFCSVIYCQQYTIQQLLCKINYIKTNGLWKREKKTK